MRRSLRTSPPAYVDLVQWIKARRRVSTGMALKIIGAGALRVDSHVIGLKTIGKGDKARQVVERCVPAERVAGGIEVALPKAAA